MDTLQSRINERQAMPTNDQVSLWQYAERIINAGPTLASLRAYQLAILCWYYTCLIDAFDKSPPQTRRANSRRMAKSVASASWQRISLAHFSTLNA
jgi:hypothetical protein